MLFFPSFSGLVLLGALLEELFDWQLKVRTITSKYIVKIFFSIFSDLVLLGAPPEELLEGDLLMKTMIKLRKEL